jgi:hypothetical protein
MGGGGMYWGGCLRRRIITRIKTARSAQKAAPTPMPALAVVVMPEEELLRGGARGDVSESFLEID